MLASQIPVKIPTPFANSAGGSFIRPVPIPSQILIQNGAASYTDGFPPDTFTSTAAGGVPPWGADMNGLMNQVTAWNRWQNAGAQVQYDSAFSTAIGGYPQGAMLLANGTTNWWLSTVDNNVTNPDTGGAGWQFIDYGTTYAGNPNGHVAGYAPSSWNLAGSLLWDSVNKILWLCTTTGTTVTAVWTQASGGGGANTIYWLGTSTGPANAQVLTPSGSLQALVTGCGIRFIPGLTNTAAMTLTITGFGTFNITESNQSGAAVALSGYEVLQGCMIEVFYDGTNFQLAAGAAASKTVTRPASQAVASVVGVFNSSHLLSAADTSGTVSDSGGTLAGNIPTPTYINASNNGLVLGPGVYEVDTRTSSGGAFLVYTPVGLSVGQNFELRDQYGTWATNNFTINPQTNTIMGQNQNLICSVQGLVFSLNATTSTNLGLQ